MQVRSEHFGLTPTCENLLEFVRYNHLELGVSAFFWALVRAPSAKVCHMPESPSLHMFVGDLNRKFRAQRLPRQILPLAPTALATRHAMFFFPRSCFIACP